LLEKLWDTTIPSTTILKTSRNVAFLGDENALDNPGYAHPETKG